MAPVHSELADEECDEMTTMTTATNPALVRDECATCEGITTCFVDDQFRICWMCAVTEASYLRNHLSDEEWTASDVVRTVLKAFETEELFASDGRTRGMVRVKATGDRLYALIGRRWCRVERADGKLVEVWTR